jgi:hypothetical protein
MRKEQEAQEAERQAGAAQRRVTPPIHTHPPDWDWSSSQQPAQQTNMAKRAGSGCRMSLCCLDLFAVRSHRVLMRSSRSKEKEECCPGDLWIQTPWTAERQGGREEEESPSQESSQKERRKQRENNKNENKDTGLGLSRARARARALCTLRFLISYWSCE